MKNKKVVLCVTGGVAAFKAAAFASKLKQTGASVKVIMTESAKQFVTPLTFQSLTRDHVYENTFIEEDVEVIAHIDVADWADAFIVVPATANFIGKYANGIADDMLTSTLLATQAPVYLAPAMNVNMYEHPAVVENMDRLRSRGVKFVEPGAGYLACGWIGKGRLAEPEDLLAYLQQELEAETSDLKGKTFVVTAGPTREVIDPVRFISNRSSGKMGYSIARAAAERGAEVILISGPVTLDVPVGVTRVSVTSAEEMYEQTLAYYDEADVVIKTAAVSDYRPVIRDEHKVKKQDGVLTLEFERTKDILEELGRKKTNQVLIGFAAETQDVIRYAEDKLERKNLDLIVANNVNDDTIGFESDENEITIIRRDRSNEPFARSEKTALAKKIVEEARLLLEGAGNRVREGDR
ncbi:bifunctional phosphopantothenoylcysteine decarboxylase/phosphopantothenate--cysteine ligase CoaBC [Geomicrobium sp. JCM 19039]|uniref:bifunctional phosphopantothenoylcysteine decarboxylase/phosphopantothenate--cysteine ligase CoaBC n=1 Tax=Geomicrobium sp. JCM 19039 TaxID=1460636 RepID=UPI00045F1211|nr:bifunctional phosphopantothenoylcysteine decarboxylase/phosphopantothenate--cysteine ligase CoaBC [Geomicrobium sp. JCM 19039]GAK10862.1 phosphopantothenoylcysteine decarboxylase [Geomicrobium sp. JCM 19039]